MTGRTTSSAPPCADECRAVLREHAEAVLRGVEVILTWAPPLFSSGYEPLNMRCPHGVSWFMEPTAEGRAQLEALPLDGAP